MNTLTKWVDAMLDGVQAILLSFLLKLGPFFVALMPALFTGYAVHSIFARIAGTYLALAFALVVAFAIETVGIVLSHTAIEQYNGWRRGKVDNFKVWLMVLLVPFYIGSVSGVVWWAGDAFHSLVQALGIVSPFLTCSVYIAVALARDLSNIEQAIRDESQHGLELERDELQYQRETERLKLRMEQERKLRELELNAQVQIEQSKIFAEPAPRPEAEPAQSQHIICEDCGRADFKTIQALNAHRRFCEGIEVGQNGKS